MLYFITICKVSCSGFSGEGVGILHGEFDISEGTSAKWIFDVEIEKLRAEVFRCREDQNHA
jgi:hypothetical protein